MGSNKVIPITRPLNKAELDSIESDVDRVRAFMEQSGIVSLRAMTVCSSILEHDKAELLRAMGKDPGVCACLPCQIKRHLGVQP